VDGTSLKLCPVAEFVNKDGETSGFLATMLDSSARGTYRQFKFSEICAQSRVLTKQK
jgi:hypothetical protein